MRAPITGLIAGLLVGCSSFELPQPPSLDALRQQYDSPTAELTEASAEAVLDAYVRKRDQLATVSGLSDLTRAIREFDDSVTVEEDGVRREVKIDGVPIDTDAEVVIDHKCDRGSIRLTAIVERSTIRDVVWGTLFNCLTTDPIPAAVSGSVDAQVPGLGDDVEEVLVRFSLSDVTVDGQDLGPIDGDFRAEAERIEILVAIEEVGSVVVGGAVDASVVSARAANGVFDCDMEERQCASESPPHQFSY